MDDDRVREYVAGLPDASGTFTGTFDPAEVDLDALTVPVPDLMPITVDTGDQPNPAATFMTTFKIKIGDDEWELPVDHVDLLGSNRVTVWVRRPQFHGAE